ncbi:PKD domain-containing protein, partial [bacterium]|nr:PKD domain-containing protein [bacterium]
DEETLSIRKTITYDEKGLTGTTAGPYFPFAYDAVTRTLFVGASWVVLAIDTTTDTVSKVIRLDGSAGAIGLRPLQLQCMNAVGLAWHPEQRLLYIAHLDRSYVSVYDPVADRFVPGVIPLKGFFPNQLSLSRDGKKLFAVNTRSDSVSVIDVATRSVEEIDLHSVLPAADSCGLACSAVAPTAAAPAVASVFGVTVTPSRCPAGSPVLSWSFGDGSSSDQPAPSHAFALPGTYTWSVTASQSGALCSASGSVNVSDPSSPAPTWVIPSSARASGAGGAFYTTDLVVSNYGTVDGTLSLRFLSHDVDGRSGPSGSFTIGAGRTTRLKDVLGSFFGLDSGWGGILVSSNVGTLAVAGETSTPAPSCG